MDDQLPKSVNRRLRSGSESVARELDQRYRKELCHLVHCELNQMFKRRQDPEDIIQSAFRSFYRRAGDGEFSFENPGALWGLLKKLTRNKMLHRIEKDKAGKRDVRREEFIAEPDFEQPDLATAGARLLGEALELALAREGSPKSEIFQLQLFGYRVEELVGLILADLDSLHAEILQKRLQGMSVRQIASNLSCGTESVRYKLERIQKRLLRLLRSP